ncbi:hypothetical protein EUTSA_v10013026mg [Eutrema salsugineum]|uniref:Aberrant root formation protein 4 n=1 Tax=Eutrema salsugineum TaxID=72664 RepID=V4LF98_EUTSA|nr:aberrant root formation protein 4 isoform X2 [Eutrema salsugineum]ESQ41057.1 hypothetical protein EUTSA_v10013026mg [Eutrema salsugineum]
MASPTIQSFEYEEMPTVTASPSRRVQELLALCSSSIEIGGSQDLESLVTDLVNCLNSLSENVASDASDELENDVIQVLAEILKFVSSPQLDQDVIDALSFELPKVISKFADVSSRCLELVEEIVDRFVEACSPRDMLSILCEALDAARCFLSPSSCSTPLLHGLSKVFISVQRRHYEQLKVAVPVVLNALKDISLETDVQVEHLLDEALRIAISIRDVSSKLKNEEGTKVRCLLGLYVIQITAILSVSIRDKVASCVPLVVQLKPFLIYCGLTHLGLITGNDTEKLMSAVAGDDDDDFISFFPDIKLGASLLFIWAKLSPEVADAALRNDVDELRSNPVKRWQAYGMLKYILSSGDLLWEFKRHTIEFLLDITKGPSSQSNDEQIDCSQYTPSIYAALQAVILVIVYAPDAGLRMKTFEALKRILSDIPAPQRFDVLRALVTNSQSPSMTAILLDLVKYNMSRSSLEATDCATADTHVIELVELVLKPPQGGPPLLPDQSDAVSAALNLYRFALIYESRGEAGKERSREGSEVLSKKNLEKAYKEWLMPLRNVLSCSIANLEGDHGDESSLEVVCHLSRIESVLYRCIELVEEKLKSH